jgi:hypothetical protein
LNVTSPLTTWVNSWPLVVRLSTTTISHLPGAGSATDRFARAVGVVDPTPCSVVVGVASAVTSAPAGLNSSYVYPLSGFASAVPNDTLIDCWPAGTSMKNSEFGEPWLRPTLVPIVAWNGPPDDGITVRASTGTGGGGAIVTRQLD